jgi:hypothetical protein
MRDPADQPETNEPIPYAYYAMLIALYQALYGLFLLMYRGKKDSLESITPLDLTMLGLATLRISKTISEDEIAAVVRRPLIETESGQKRPRGDGLRWALGKLVLCPTCTGTWVAAFLGYGLHLFPRHTRPLLAIMSASGAEQFSDALLSLVYTDRDLLRRQEDNARHAAPPSGS